MSTVSNTVFIEQLTCTLWPSEGEKNIQKCFVKSFNRKAFFVNMTLMTFKEILNDSEIHISTLK